MDTHVPFRSGIMNLLCVSNNRVMWWICLRLVDCEVLFQVLLSLARVGWSWLKVGWFYDVVLVSFLFNRGIDPLLYFVLAWVLLVLVCVCLYSFKRFLLMYTHTYTYAIKKRRANDPLWGDDGCMKI